MPNLLVEPDGVAGRMPALQICFRRNAMRNKWIVALSVFGSLLLADVAILAQADVDKEIEMLRKDVRAERKRLVAANLPLTTEEAVKFWPVYEQYVAEGAKILDTRVAVIKDYATNYDSLTDQKAQALIKKSIDIDKALVQLRFKYVPLVEKVLPAKKAVMFFQIDRRLSLLVDLQLAAEIPLVNP